MVVLILKIFLKFMTGTDWWGQIGVGTVIDPSEKGACQWETMCRARVGKNFIVSSGTLKNLRGKVTCPVCDSKEVNGLFPVYFSLHLFPRNKIFHFQENSSNFWTLQVILHITSVNSACLFLLRRVCDLLKDLFASFFEWNWSSIWRI